MTRDKDSPQWFDGERTARMAGYTLAITPLVHVWYGTLVKTFPASPVKRMAADQILFAPTGLVLFLLSMGLLETGSLATGQMKLQENFMTVMQANYLVSARSAHSSNKHEVAVKASAPRRISLSRMHPRSIPARRRCGPRCSTSTLRSFRQRTK
jgi:hypothetical protein